MPLMVTEWGSVDANGDGGVDEQESRIWVEWMRKNELTHCYWSMHSKAEAASILLPGSPPDANWTDANFSQSGKLIRDIIKNWPGNPLSK